MKREEKAKWIQTKGTFFFFILCALLSRHAAAREVGKTHHRRVTAWSVESGDDLVEHADVEGLGEVQQLLSACERHLAFSLAVWALLLHSRTVGAPLPLVDEEGAVQRCASKNWRGFDSVLAIPTGFSSVPYYYHTAFFTSPPQPWSISTCSPPITSLKQTSVRASAL